MGKALELVKWVKGRAGNLLEGVGSKRVAIIVAIFYALLKLENLSANVVAVCVTILGVFYIASEVVIKLKTPVVPEALEVVDDTPKVAAPPKQPVPAAAPEQPAIPAQ